MRLLIDTCNVLHRTGILPPELAGVDETGLVGLVQNSRYRNLRLDFMCDGPALTPEGPRGEAAGGRCRFFFAGRDRSADCLIIKAIKDSSSPRRLLVVSSDRTIQVEARKRRSRVLCADDFLAQLANDHGARAGRAGRGDPLGDGLGQSTQAWMREFGLEDHESEPVAEEGDGDADDARGPVRHPLDEQPETSPPPGSEPDERWAWLMEEADRLWRKHEGR